MSELILRFLFTVVLASFVAAPVTAQQNDAELDLLADQIAAAYFGEGESVPRIELASATSTIESDPFVSESFSRDRGSRIGRHRGVVQFGYAYTRDEFDGLLIEDHITPDMLLRYRLTDRFEMRLAWGGYLRSTITDELFAIKETDDDVVDPTVGFKWRLWNQRTAIPTVSLLASVPIATEGNPFATRSLLPAVDVLYGWQLSDTWSVAGSSGLILLDDDGNTRENFQQSVSLNFLMNDSLAIFADTSLLVTDDGKEVVGTTGFQWLMTDRLQLSPFLGIGLNEEAPDLQTGIGFGWSF